MSVITVDDSTSSKTTPRQGKDVAVAPVEHPNLVWRGLELVVWSVISSLAWLSLPVGLVAFLVFVPQYSQLPTATSMLFEDVWMFGEEAVAYLSAQPILVVIAVSAVLLFILVPILFVAFTVIAAGVKHGAELSRNNFKRYVHAPMSFWKRNWQPFLVAVKRHRAERREDRLQPQ